MTVLPKASRALIGVSGLALIFCISCKENQSSSRSNEKVKCGPISTQVVSADPEVIENSKRPRKPGDAALTVEGDKNSLWKVQVTGGTPPYRIESVKGFDFEDGSGQNASAVFNAQMNLTDQERKEWPNTEVDTDAVTATVVDANGCRSTDDKSTLVATVPKFPTVSAWAAFIPVIPVPTVGPEFLVVEEPAPVTRSVTTVVTTTTTEKFGHRGVIQ